MNLVAQSMWTRVAARTSAQLLGLRGDPAIAAVELRGGRSGDQRMRAAADLDVDAQLVTAHHSAGRMHDVGVAGITLGMERTLDHEWPAMTALEQACLRRRRGDAEPQMQLGLPAAGGGNGFSGVASDGPHCYTVRC
jgi:hypothetical protein